MPEFKLKYWKPVTGSKRRVYIEIDGDYHHPVKMYWEKMNSQDTDLEIRGGYNDIDDFPMFYFNSQDPREDLARDALTQHEIDPDDFDWGDLKEACL